MDANLIYFVDDEANIIDFVRVYLEKSFFLKSHIQVDSLVQKIALAHGDEITVTGELGKGSYFMVKLPLVHEK